MIIQSDARQIPLADESVQCVITSPPYYGLRSYDVDNQIGLEDTLDEYLDAMVAVMREVWRVLRKDGVVWLNIGDSYNNFRVSTPGQQLHGRELRDKFPGRRPVAHNLKEKDLMMVPHRLAIRLQDDGWWLRQEIVWHKPNPMPESVTDRCTRSHEYVFMLTKAARYYYDADAIREDATYGQNQGIFRGGGKYVNNNSFNNSDAPKSDTAGIFRPPNTSRNKRSVWTIATAPYSQAHFATFAPALIEPMVLAGTSEKGCCAECGAPIVREMKATGGTIGKSWTDHKNDLSMGMSQYEGGDIGGDARLRGDPYTRETTGWRPSCSCEASTVPCVVLDPFCGSGTVGEVCRTHKRKFVGLDLNGEYLRDFALPRAEQTQSKSSLNQLPLFS